MTRGRRIRPAASILGMTACLFLLCANLSGSAPRPRLSHAAAAQSVAPAGGLEGVLAAIDNAAHDIHSVVADSQSDQYTAVVDDHTIESGQLYYRKASHGPEMALYITQPAASEKTFIYKNETGWMYIPRSKQVQKYDLSKNRSVVEQFLLLGLGGTGHDLLKSFTVRLVGEASLGNIPTVELELKPRHADLANSITAIDLWYSTRTWVAIQQRVVQRGGDYRQLHYTHIEINAHIPDSRFSTKFPGATVVIAH